jgi:sRNA-binding regulator protein Hfq
LVAAADWSGGVAVRLVGGDVVLMSDEWGEVRLARKLVSGIVFSLQSRVDDRERMIDSLGARARELPSPARSSANDKAADDASDNSVNGKSMNTDSVQLTNGDQLTGKLTELDRGSLAIDALGGAVKLPVSRGEMIRLAGEQHVGGFVEKQPAARMIVGTREGSMIFANAMRANDKGVEIEMACGVKLKGDSLDEIVAIQSLAGPIVYLSDLKGANYRSVPYLSMAWPYRRDRNVLGEPIDVRGERYWKGIGMHSAARLTYALDRPYARFESAVAVDDSAEGRGSVTFAVYVQRDGKWGEAFKSGVVRGGDAPLPVSVDLRGAKGITLTVDFADHGDELDHAVWLDPRLVR